MIPGRGKPAKEGRKEGQWRDSVWWWWGSEPRAATTDCVLQLLNPVPPELVLRNKRSHHNEKPMHCN